MLAAGRRDTNGCRMAPTGMDPLPSQSPGWGLVPFDAFWICLAALLVCSAGALERLRNDHRGVWRLLGAPRFVPLRLAPARALSRFYWSGTVSLLDDPALSRWVQALRVFQVALYGILAHTAWSLAGTLP